MHLVNRKSEELLGKLIIKLQSEGKDVTGEAPTPQPAPKPSPRRRQSVASTSNVATASPRRKSIDPSVVEKAMDTPVTAPRRKSLDASKIQRAINTPLPPPKPTSQGAAPTPVSHPGTTATRRATPSPVTFLAIFVLMYAAGLAAPKAANYIREYDYASGIGNLKSDVGQMYGAAVNWSHATAVQTGESFSYYKIVADEKVRKIARETSLKIQTFVSYKKNREKEVAMPHSI